MPDMDGDGACLLVHSIDNGRLEFARVRRGGRRAAPELGP
jgi:hypothetical protein